MFTVGNCWEGRCYSTSGVEISNVMPSKNLKLFNLVDQSYFLKRKKKKRENGFVITNMRKEMWLLFHIK